MTKKKVIQERESEGPRRKKIRRRVKWKSRFLRQNVAVVAWLQATLRQHEGSILYDEYTYKYFNSKESKKERIRF